MLLGTEVSCGRQGRGGPLSLDGSGTREASPLLLSTG